MVAFQKTIGYCDLSDLVYRGPMYTWSNCREGSSFIKERLDRVVANKAWCTRFPKVDVSVEVAVNSDHSPLFLNIVHTLRGNHRKKRGFLYEATWARGEECVVKF